MIMSRYFIDKRNNFAHLFLFFLITLINPTVVKAAYQNINTNDDCVQQLNSKLSQADEQERKKSQALTLPIAWVTYINQTKEAKTPQKTLVLALNIYRGKNLKPGYAVDLGSGTGKDTLYLLNKGWQVVAVDFSAKAITILRTRAEENNFIKLQTQIADFKQMQLPPNLDMINATYSLPFVEPQHFLQVWQDVNQHLRPGGFFVGNFFGPTDDFAKDNSMTLLNKQQILCLFKDYKIHYLNERKLYANQVKGKRKYWDIWDVVAEKF